MILIDDRDGSNDLPKLFPADLVAVASNLPADVIISDPGGDRTIGIEFKKVPDLLKCIVDGRIAGHQLPTMIEAGFDDIWLLVEGEYRVGMYGELMIEEGGRNGRHWTQAHVGNRVFKYSDVKTWMMTMQNNTRLMVDWTRDRVETKIWIMTMYNWWQTPDSHKSHLAVNKAGNSRRADLTRPTIVREWAERLPGVGTDKAMDVSRRFDTCFDLVTATESQWCEVPGISNLMAGRIVAAINKKGATKRG